MLHGCEDVGGTGICSDRGGDQLREAAPWSRNRSSCHRSPSADLRRCPYISYSSISRTQERQAFFEKHNEVKNRSKKDFRFDEFHDGLDLTKTRVKKFPLEEKGTTVSSDYQKLKHFNMTKDLGTLDSKQESGVNCGSHHQKQEQKNFDPGNENKGTSPGRKENDCDDKCLPWNAVDPLLDGRCQTTSDHPYWDADFWIPRRPLARGRLYHFNVIYHNARTRLSRTADSDLALRVTTALVERLEMRGYVNSYYHDRDHRHENTMTCELERVIAESSVTILLLTPGFIDQCLSSYLNIPAFRQLVSGPRLNHRLLALSVGVPSQCMPQLLLTTEILYFQQDWQVDIPTWTRFDTAVMGFLQEQKELCMTQHREDLTYELGKHKRNNGAHDRNDRVDVITKSELRYDIVDGVSSIRNGDNSDDCFPRTKTEKQRKLDVDESKLSDPLSDLYDVDMSAPLEQIYDMPCLYKTYDETYSLPSDFVQRPTNDFDQTFTHRNIDELGQFQSIRPPDDTCQFAGNECQQYNWTERKLLNFLRDEDKDKDFIPTDQKARALPDTEHDSLEMKIHMTHETEKLTSPENHHADQSLGKSQTTARANQLLIDFSNKLFDRLTSDEMEDIIIIPELTNEGDARSEVAEDDSEDGELSLIYKRGHSFLPTSMKDEIFWKETFQEISELTSVGIFHKLIPDTSSSPYVNYDGEFSHSDEPYRKGTPDNVDNRTTVRITEHTDWLPHVTENRSLGELVTVRDPGLVDMTDEDTDKWSRQEYFYRDRSAKKGGNDFDRLDVTSRGGELPIMDSRSSRVFDITTKWDTDDNSTIEWTGSYNLTTEDTAEEKITRVCIDQWETPHDAYNTWAWGSCSLDKPNSNDDLGKENASAFLSDQNLETPRVMDVDGGSTSFSNDELSFEERLEKWAAHGADIQTVSENTYLKTLDSTVNRTPLADLAVERCFLDATPSARESLLQQWDDDIRAYKTEQDSLYTGQHSDSFLIDFLKEMIDYLSFDQSVENGKTSDLDVHQGQELDWSVTETDRQIGDGQASLEISNSRYKYRESDLLMRMIPYVQDRDIQGTEGIDTKLSSNQPITAELRQWLTEKSTANNTEILIHRKQSDHIHEDREPFLSATNHTSQEQVLQKESESFLDSHVLEILTATQTTRKLTSSLKDVRNMANNEKGSFSTVETEKDDCFGIGHDPIDKISSADVLQTFRDSSETRKVDGQINRATICENKDTTGGILGGFETDNDNKEFAQEDNSTNIGRYTTLKFIQTLSESVKEVQETNEHPRDSTDGPCTDATCLGSENEMPKVERCRQNSTTQTKVEDLVAILADFEEVKSESTTSGNDNEKVKSEGKASGDNEKVKSESASVAESEEVKSDSTILGDMGEVKSEGTTLGGIEEVKSEATALGETKEQQSEDTTLGEIEEVKSEANTLGETKEQQSEDTTSGEIEEVKSAATTLSDIGEVKSEANTLGETKEQQSEDTTLGEIEEVKSDATTLGETKEEQSEGTILGEIEEVKSEATTLGDIEEVKSEATTLGDIEEVNSEATILGDIEEVNSEATILGDIEEVNSEATILGDIEEEKSEATTLGDIEEVKTEATTLSNTGEMKSKGTTLDDTQEVKLNATTLNNIEEIKPESTILDGIKEVNSNRTTFDTIEEIKSESTTLADIERVKSEHMTLSKNFEVVKSVENSVCDIEEVKLEGQTSDDNEEVKSEGITDSKQVILEKKILGDNNEEVKLESTVLDNTEGMKSEYHQTDRSNEICSVEQLCGKIVVTSTEKKETEAQTTVCLQDLSCIYDQSSEARIGAGFKAERVTDEKLNEDQLEACSEKISDEIVEPRQDNTKEEKELRISGKSWQLQSFSETSEGQTDSRSADEDALGHISLLSKRQTDSISFRASKSTDVDSGIITTETDLDETDSVTNVLFNTNGTEKIVKSDSLPGNDQQKVSETIAAHSVITPISDEGDVSLDNKCQVSSSLRGNTEETLLEPLILCRDEVYRGISQFSSSTEPVQSERGGNTTSLSHLAMTGSNSNEGEGSPFEPQEKAIDSTTEYNTSGFSNREPIRLLPGEEKNTEDQRSTPIDCSSEPLYKRIQGEDSEHGVCPGKTDRSSNTNSNALSPIMTSFISNIESLQNQSGAVNIVAQSIVQQIKISNGQEEVTSVMNTTGGQELQSNALARSEIESHSIEQHAFQSEQRVTSQHKSWVNIISNVSALSRPIKDGKSSNISNVLQILNEDIHLQDITASARDNIVAIHIAMEIDNKESSRLKKRTLDSPASPWKTDEMNETAATTQGGEMWLEKNREDITSTRIIPEPDTNGESICVIPDSSSETTSIISSQLFCHDDIPSYVTNTATTAKSSKSFQQSVTEALNASYATLGEEEDHFFFAGAGAESPPRMQHNDELISLSAGAESEPSPRVHDRDNAGISSSPRNPMDHNDTIGDPFLSPRGLMYQEGDSGYFGEKPDSLSHLDENQAAGTDQTEKSPNMYRPVEYNILCREDDEAEVKESDASNNPVIHSANHADLLNLQTGIRNFDNTLPSAPDAAPVLWNETSPEIRHISDPTEQSSQGEGRSSSRQQSSDFRFYIYRADCVSTEGSSFSGHADLGQLNTLTWQPAAKEDAGDQSEARLSAGTQGAGDDGGRSENEHRATHEIILSTGSQEPETDQGAAAEATLSGEERSGSGNAEPKEKANWWLEIYKGVCHTLAKPDMPYMG